MARVFLSHASDDRLDASSALDIPQPQPAVLHDLGPGETAIFRPEPAGKTTLLARIDESAWPKLLQALAPHTHQLDADTDGKQVSTGVPGSGRDAEQSEDATVTDNSSTIDTTVPQSARIWNYWLGGKDNYPVDREVGDQFREVFPDIIPVARASRAFIARSVRYLAGETGIRQFLDIGTGLPSANNTHEVAQRVAPDSRIVYVDNDPLVLAHARALLTSTPEGACQYIDADLREPDTILQAAVRTLDFGQPVALMLNGILGHITDGAEAYTIVSRLMDALPSRSYLALNDGTNVVHGKEFDEAIQVWNQASSAPYCLRSIEQIARFFDSLELVEPGIVSCPRWRPEANPFGVPAEVDAFGGVGRKP